MVSSLSRYAALLALVAIERVIELVISRRNTARALARGAAETGRAHYPAMVAMHAALLPSCAFEAWWTRAAFPGALGCAALAGALAAQCLRYWVIATLGPRWSARVIVWPDAQPVTSGPYHFVRHPNYLAVIVEVACLPLVHGAWRTALLFSAANAAILAVRVRVEERALGPLYAAAFKRRARFVPEVMP